MTDAPDPLDALRDRLRTGRMRLLMALASDSSPGPLPDGGALRLLADVQSALDAIADVTAPAKPRRGRR